MSYNSDFIFLLNLKSQNQPVVNFYTLNDYLTFVTMSFKGPLQVQN